MTGHATSTARVDVDQLRARHRIEDVVATSGVELHPAGRSLMGCCPFHDDPTASLSVGGVPDRFHCFGCGASGDVIEYVARLRGLSFREAVEHLDHAPTAPTIPPAAQNPATRHRSVDVPVERAYAVNLLAWQHWTRPVNHEFALAYLRHYRGIDLHPAETVLGGRLVGHTGTAWASLTNHLARRGVTTDELVALDLAHATRRGTLIDTMRGRLVVPVRDEAGHITGFLGRDTTGDPRAPKYRNPTRTAVFDKATMLYSPQPLTPTNATVLVVEGPLDALAVTAAAAATRIPVMACTAAGVAVTPTQADRVAALSQGRPVLVALDGDTAGREGAARWVQLLHGRLSHPVRLVDLPDGRDPADWIADHGPNALGDLLARARHPAYQPERHHRPDPAQQHEPLRPQL
ncbi:CHC2 zinc finger domain-containing protein [Pedococcus sp. P5_B7]